MAGIGVVLNPRSRRNLGDPGAATRLARTLGDHGVVREARSRDELHDIAADFKRFGIDILGISGGDGTNHVTLTGFIEVYKGIALPRVAFLRGGTMNTVANSLGVQRGRPEGLLERLIQAYVEEKTKPLANVRRRVMNIGGQYGFIFGTGIVCGYMSEYYAGGTPSAVVGAKTVIRGIGSAIVQGEMIRRMAEPFRGKVVLADGTTWEERDYLSVAAGTVDQIGLNFRPFYRCLERSDAFHLLGIKTTALGFAGQLPRVWQGKPMRDGCTEEAVTARAAVLSSGKTTRYMIDGDLHDGPPELEISMGPRVEIVVA